MSKAAKTLISLKAEGMRMCRLMLDADDFTIDIEEERENLIRIQTTERKKNRIRNLPPVGVLFELFYADEYRNEKVEATHSLRGSVKDLSGSLIPVDDAKEMLEFTRRSDFNRRSYDTERQIEAFENMDAIGPIVDRNLSPRQKQILMDRDYHNVPREDVAKDLGTNPDSISQQNRKAQRKLRENEQLRSVFVQLKGTHEEEQR